jgi:predicted Fe-Mo cluster-binding NifX family protein
MGRLAVTLWKHRVSPVFESAGRLLVVDALSDRPWQETLVDLDRGAQLEKLAKLSELEVGVFICGAISGLYANLIQAHGIRLVPFVSGEARAVIQAYTQGPGDFGRFKMPGCRGKRRRRFRGRR